MESDPAERSPQRFNLLRPQFFHFSRSDASSLPGLVDEGRRSAWSQLRALAAWVVIWAVAAMAIVLASARVELSLVLYEMVVLTTALAATALLGLWSARREANTLNRYLWEMWRYNIRLEQSAARDSLTGLYDRVHFMDMLAEEFHRARTGKSPFSLLVMDLKNFGEINRRFGSDVGDQVIRAVAKRLSSTVRSGDLVARIGDDEFAVLTVDSNEEQAEQLARRLAEVALALPFAQRGQEGQDIELSAFFAVAAYDRRFGSPSELMTEALAKLHQHRSKRRAA
jgi:diguanylate cyclase (GGDEF)-like protein